MAMNPKVASDRTTSFKLTMTFTESVIADMPEDTFHSHMADVLLETLRKLGRRHRRDPEWWRGQTKGADDTVS
jgi:hypothetical protein